MVKSNKAIIGIEEENISKEIQKINNGVKLLGKIKIHEIAKKLGLASKEVLEAANNIKIEAKAI